MRIEAASPVFWLASRVKIPVGLGGPSLRPMMWMFLAILVTFGRCRHRHRRRGAHRRHQTGQTWVMVGGAPLHQSTTARLAGRQPLQPASPGALEPVARPCCRRPLWGKAAEMSPSVTSGRCRVWQVISSARPVPVGWSGRANVTTSIVRGGPSRCMAELMAPIMPAVGVCDGCSATRTAPRTACRWLPAASAAGGVLAYMGTGFLWWSGSGPAGRVRHCWIGGCAAGGIRFRLGQVRMWRPARLMVPGWDLVAGSGRPG